MSDSHGDILYGFQPPSRTGPTGTIDSTGATDSMEGGRIRRGVIGIVCRNDQYLLIQRAARVAMGGAWCFPGGHIERGENARRAIVREMREELGIEVVPVHRLGAVKGRPDVMLAIWIVEHAGGKIQPNTDEVSDFRWCSAAQIKERTDGLPSNHHVVDLLEAWRRAH